MASSLRFLLVLFLASNFARLRGHTVKRTTVATGKGVVVCYVSSWATYRVNSGKFTVNQIDPSLCTHLVYAFAGLNATTNTMKPLDVYNDLEENQGLGSYKKITGLKARYPHLKVTLAIGGWNEGSAAYSAMAANPDARKTFTKSVMDFMMKYDFDGLDLDWEYPAKRGGKPEDKENFIELIKDLRTELLPGKHLLTAALGANIETIKAAYDLVQINKYLDYLHLMCYDYHGSWESFTGPNAPLYSADPSDPLTVEKSVKYLLENGVNPRKLVLGVPLYGRTFLVAKEASEGKLGEQSLENKGFQGPYTRTDGFLGYNEICEELKHDNWTIHWDNVTKTALATNGKKVISYDDQNSIREKVKFAMAHELGGLMVWSMDTDDFRGECPGPGDSKGRPYPILNTIIETMDEAWTDYHGGKSEGPNAANSHSFSPLIFLFLLPSIFLYYQ